MKNIFTHSGHKILSLIVATVMLFSGAPISAAQNDLASGSGITLLSNEAEPGAADLEDSDADKSGDGDTDHGQQDDGIVATPGVTAPPSDNIPLGYSVVAFALLADGVTNQTAMPDTVLEDLSLPESLDATVSDGKTEIETTIEGVTWSSEPEYEAVTIGALEIVPVGTYVFYPNLPEGYTISDGVDLPVITVMVEPLGIVPSADATWSDGTSVGAQTISGGIITVTGTVTLTGTLTCSGNVTFTGNGTILRDSGFTSGSMLNLSANANVTINGVTIDGNNVTTSQSAVLLNYDGAKLTLESGGIVNNRKSTPSSSTAIGGAAVAINTTDSSTIDAHFIMNGGTVSGNSITVGYTYGSAIYVGGSSSNSKCGRFTMNGGTISGNVQGGAVSSFGGAIYVRGFFTMTEGTITNNSANSRGGAVYISSYAKGTISGGKIIGNKTTYSSGTISNGTDADIFFSSATSGQSGQSLHISGNAEIGKLYVLLSATAIFPYISSTLQYPITMTFGGDRLKINEVVAAGSDGYILTEEDMKKIINNTTTSTGVKLYLLLDAANNRIVFTDTDPGYGTYRNIIINVKRNATDWADHGKTLRLMSGGTAVYTVTSDTATVEMCAPPGIYELWDDNGDTGMRVTVTDSDVSIDLNYIFNITSAAITVTAPVITVAPDTTATISGGTNFSVGAVSWSPGDSLFQGSKQYTATVTLTANSGYTFTGGLSTATINGKNATVTNNGDTATLSYTFPATTAATITGISVKTQPTKIIYMHGESLDLSGLVATLAHNDGTTKDVTFADFGANSITTSPMNGTTLSRETHNGTSVTVSCNGKSVTTSVLAVNKATATVTVTAPANITYGETLGDPGASVSVGGASTYTYNYTGTIDGGGSYNSASRPDKPGSYTVTATLVNDDYSGSGTATFTINKKTLTWDADGVVATKQYDGTKTAAISSNPTLNGVINSDTVSVSAGMAAFSSANAGAAVTASGWGISGVNSAWYNSPTAQPVFSGTITKRPLMGAEITLPDTSFTYTGSEIRPGVTSVTVGGVSATSGDYTVSYSNNTSVGTSATVTVTATSTGNFSGSAGMAFSITKATPDYTTPTGLSAVYGQTLADVTLPNGYTWEQAATTSAGTVSGPNNFTVKYTPSDTDNYNAVTGIGVSITVSPRDISNATIATISPQTYTGSPITPVLTVSDGSIIITSGDYTVSYGANNTNVGTIIVTLTGQGNYTGTTTTTFSIVEALITGMPIITVDGTMKIGATLTANVGGIVPAGAQSGLSYQWKINGAKAGINSDYTVLAADVGKTITVTVTASGNYTGSQTSNTTATVPYTVVVNGYNSGGDSVTAQTIYKNAGETVSIVYTLPNTHIENKLTLSANGDEVATTTTTGTNATVVYTVNAAHATNGVITITADVSHASVLTTANVTVTAPSKGQQPQLSIIETAYYTGAISWSGALTPDSKFAGGAQYTATITLTAKGDANFDSSFTPTISSGTVGSVVVSGSSANVTFTVSYDALPPREVESIAVTAEPAKITYYSGDTLDMAELVITATYDDGTTDTVTPDGYEINGAAVIPDSTVLTNATYGDKPVTIIFDGKTANTVNLAVNKLTVQLGEITGNAGSDNITLATVQRDVDETVSIGYTLDGMAIINRLELGHGLSDITTPATSTVMYVVAADHAVGGTITFNPAFTHQSILTSADVFVTAPTKAALPQDTITTGSIYYIGEISWGGNPSVFLGSTIYTADITLNAQNGASFDNNFALTVNGIAASKVSVNGTTAVFTYTFPQTLARTVNSISVKTQPELVYVAGDRLDLSSLAITAAYDDTAIEDITYNKSGIAYEVNGTAVTNGVTVMTNSAHDSKAVTITYGSKTADTSALTVYTTPTLQISAADITSISAKIIYKVTNGSNTTTSKLQTRSGNVWTDVSGASSPYTATPLTPATSYEYRVWAKDNTTGREYMSPVTFRTSESAPAGITVSGTVTDPSNTADITVSIEHGNTVIASVIIAGSGIYDFSFSNIPDGIYNLVSDNGSYKVTQAVTVNGVDVSGINIDMAGGNTQSVVDIVTNDTPPAAVGGLPDLFNDPAIYTAEDKAIVTGNGTVEIKLTAEKQDAPLDAGKIDHAASGQTVGLYLDLSVIKSHFDKDGVLLGYQPLHDLKGNLITITFELPDYLKGLSNLTIYRVHSGNAEALTSTPNADGETAVISDDIVTLEVCKFSTYAVAYTPKSPTNPSNPSSSGGSSSGVGNGNGTNSTSISAYWIEVAEAKTMTKDAKEKGLDNARSSRATITGIRKNSLLIMSEAGLRYRHDTVAGNAVQVRLYIDEPSKAAKDILVSGNVKGYAVDKVKTRFEKWFTNKIAVISFDAQGDFGMKIRIAAKVDLNGMDANNLYFYGYDRQANKYARILTEYRIDANGYLNFATIRAGDIIVSDGPLTKKAKEQMVADGNKYFYLSEPPALEMLNVNGSGDSMPNISVPVQEAPNSGSTGGDSAANQNIADVPLTLEIISVGGTAKIDTFEPARQDAVNAKKDSQPNVLLMAGIMIALLFATMILWTVIPRKDDALISVEEYRKNH